MEDESMQFDVVIVGGGPSGLSAACRLRQLNPELEVCVLEKGAEVGAHLLSGAVFEPRALTELFPDWPERGAPLTTPVERDEVHLFRGERSGWRLPAWCVPDTLHNSGNYIISLGELCRWLADQAEELGVQIFPGFSAAEVVYDGDNGVAGVLTGAKGLDRTGNPKADHIPGLRILGTYTLFAEGCRGHLGKELIARFGLDSDSEPQHYGLGIKEVWEVPEEQHRPGFVLHSAGWPLSESGSNGGGFLYHLNDRQVAVGLITDLSYSNPHLSPFEEFQRFKHQSQISAHLKGGERIAYGARAIAKGGIQSLPRMSFNGGLLLGDNAGTLNFAKIKGNHTAMKSGMVAAELIAKALTLPNPPAQLDFDQAFRETWAWDELYRQRNFGPALHKWGTLAGALYGFFDLKLCRGRVPWTLSDPVPDHAQLVPAEQASPVAYPKPDGVLSFDRLSSVYLSNTQHGDDQPCHLQLADRDVPIKENLPRFGEPAQRYCPAGVYEVLDDTEDGSGGTPRFHINPQNCVHCKTCDIKDPAQNITWVPPEGGEGPVYSAM